MTIGVNNLNRDEPVSQDPLANRTDIGELELWLSVIDRAVRDMKALEGYLDRPNIMNNPVFRYDFRTLRKWFLSDLVEPGSFVWICNLFDMDPKVSLRRLEQKWGVRLLTNPYQRKKA